MRPEDALPVRLEDYRPPDYLIDAVELDVRLAPEATRIAARLSVRRREGAAPATPLALDGDKLVLTGLALDGLPLTEAAYEAHPDRLTIHAPPAEPFRLDIQTEVDPSANTALMGLYRSNGVYTTQCEAEGFRRITYFLDRPDVLSVYTIRLEARKGEAPVLLANGNCMAAGDVPGTDRHYAVWHDPFPKPCYLFALVGGDLAAIHDSFRTASGREVALAIYCEPGKQERCRYAMEALKRCMRWDEERFGREYDLDVFNIVAVSDFNMGAMENKGLNIFNDKYVLVDEETGTDSDFAHVEAVIAHEYFHNWTGNRITCRDWFQLCLKEGLTVFRDQEFSADMRSRPVKRIADVVTLRQHQFPEDAGPLAHPVRPTAYREINNFYTATVYEKGAEICRMLQTLLGPATFRAGLDLYFSRFDGQAVTIEDFLSCFEAVSEAPLDQFALWYHQVGTPRIMARHAWDEETGQLTLSLAQELTETPDGQPKAPLHVPIAFGLVGPDGQDLSWRSASGGEVRDGIIHLRSRSAEIVFEGLPARPIPSLLRSFSAPVRLETDLATEDLLALVGGDPDPFNRWEAVQQLAMNELKQAVSRLRFGEAPRFDTRLAEALARLADNDELDPAVRALALTLPGEIDIAQAIGSDVDPDCVHAARRGLQAFLGRALAAIVASAAERQPAARPYSPDPESAGRRALRHSGWELALAAEPGFSVDLLKQFAAAGNLTDRFAALRLLSHHHSPQADGALVEFHDRYRDNPLVLDKWFAVQATTPGHATLDRVELLTRHARFSLAVPNRVYALVRSFGAGNPTGFNRPDGAGYRFLAGMTASLDKQNPSVAARLATCFRSFRMLEPARRDAAEGVLRELAARPDLSRDLSDILARTLSG
jgi:aminopeptidase N